MIGASLSVRCLDANSWSDLKIYVEALLHIVLVGFVGHGLVVHRPCMVVHGTSLLYDGIWCSWVILAGRALVLVKMKVSQQR